MSDLRFQQPIRQSALVRQGGGPGHTRTLQSANKEALSHLGLPSETPGDPKGRILRQLRLQLGIDPSLLATQACMSLSQLYELEDGGNSRFYSESLRRQAGRRVARLLGADWDRMEQEARAYAHPVSNVVPLQRPGTSPMPPAIVEVKVRVAPEPIQAITMTADEAPTTPAPKALQTVSMGLATPASETVLVEPPVLHYTAPAVEVQTPSSTGRTVLILLTVIALGAAGAYAFVEYSPYRLYWPW